MLIISDIDKSCNEKRIGIIGIVIIIIDMNNFCTPLRINLNPYTRTKCLELELELELFIISKYDHIQLRNKFAFQQLAWIGCQRA